MGIETICAKEAVRLVRRDSKYWLGVSHMYLAGLSSPHKSRVFRAAYFFCRHIDDILDGDRAVSSDPIAYVHSILEGMDGKAAAPEIVDLYRFVIARAKSGEMASLRRDFREIISVMLFDYERSKCKRILTKQELDDYYSRTFTPVLNISLQIAGSGLRGGDLTELVSAMGCLYSVRDMEADLSKGIVNIPKEELVVSNLKGLVTYEQVLGEPHLSRWMDEEVKEQGRSLPVIRDKLKREGDRGSRTVCFPLIGSLERYCSKYFQQKH